MMRLFSLIIVCGMHLVGQPVFAGLSGELENLVGYTVLAAKTIDGYIDEDGEKSDGFEGCDFDRKIFFDDGTYVTCSGYGYSYSYRPTAILFGKQGAFEGRSYIDLKMVVDDDIYDLQLQLLNAK